MINKTTILFYVLVFWEIWYLYECTEWQ